MPYIWSLATTGTDYLHWKRKAVFECVKFTTVVNAIISIPFTQTFCNAAEEETASIESEHILAESTIEQEKTKTEVLEHQIKSLEERLVQGGGGKDLINNLNESQIILEQRNTEIAERKKREVEMQQKIDLEEETTTIVTNTFATLQQEVDHKTQR
ncbi:jg4214 [Pararge aegeria aegeria]|uniref:Jg4214 protein n=1 Tax=Pararge aegeria aegeria TaxID=348720 RepID=A0A8S4R477_9NEOP|nr:jg4214 [Pararge aegeria aegeria]